MSNDIARPASIDEAVSLVPIDPFKTRRAVAVYLDQSGPERVAQLGRALVIDETNWPDELTLVTAVGITVRSRRVSKHDDAAEKYGCYVIVHDKDGRNWVTASQLVLESLPELVPSVGQPPWPSGVELTIGKVHKAKGDLGRGVIAAGDVTVAPGF